MMRYQRVSPDCLPLSNGRKPILRICKEDDADSGRIAGCNGFEGKTHRFRPGSTPSSSQDHNFSQFLVSDSLQPENHTLTKSQINHESGSGGGDILLQWGQKKRSRGSRAESRAVADETSSQAKQTVKIHRRLVTGVEKRTTSAAMSPPSVVSSHNRTANHRPSMPVRETTAGSSLCRNLEERSNIGNGSQLGNGNGRVHSRSAEKRSPQSPEKMEKMTPSSGQGGEKQKGTNVQAEPMNVASVPQSEPEAGVAAEKLNMDLFEWPRIYIALSRKEKEDDFLKMKGTKLPQRPKKRAKNVDKTLQYCFPGLWLSDLTRSRYEVREKKCVKKVGILIFFLSPFNLLILLIKCISNETAVFLFEKWQRLPYNEMISYEGGVPLSFM
eukprot:TRINITY_DN3685_c0_g1_i5.p1 TRINITY_DN3685_c0_g1~~TRINITY_DN3685_c0_g1_i5.p1  ORF type:complete len:384 (+),score=64.59 TRINITY_DN3685_c0_g1_i5:297-1448(+)